MSDMVNVHAKYWKMIGDLDRDKTELCERIKQLEKELMEVKNKHSVLVADVALYEDRADRIHRLEELGKELRECAGQLGWTSSEDSRWIERAEAAVKAWDKAKEDKL